MNDSVRRDFPVVQEFNHLNSAMISPLPTPVMEAVRGYFDGRQAIPTIKPWLAKADEVRHQVATLIGARFEEIGFAMSTADGINLVASAIDWRAGDNVVLDDLAYVSDFVLWQHYEQAHDIELRIVQNQEGAVPVEAFARQTDKRTRLISISYVSHHNGYLHEIRSLADLAHAYGAYLYTDAIQAVGAIPIDVRADDVDVLACGTYKWVFGPFGLAFLYVKEELLDRIPPNKFGFLQRQNFQGPFRDWPAHHTAKQYEYGTYNFGGIYEFGAGLDYIESIGLAHLSTHIVGLAHRIWDGLNELGYRMYTPQHNQTPIVTCFLEHADRVAAALEEANISVTVREDHGEMRVSPGIFNIQEEVDAFLSCMAGVS
jgi:selenocysteine lyase/cysteine desulfurase